MDLCATVTGFKAQGPAMGPDDARDKAQAHAATGYLFTVCPHAAKKGFEDLCPLAARDARSAILNSKGCGFVLDPNHDSDIIPCFCVLENICKEISENYIQGFRIGIDWGSTVQDRLDDNPGGLKFRPHQFEAVFNEFTEFDAPVVRQR